MNIWLSIRPLFALTLVRQEHKKTRASELRQKSRRSFDQIHLATDALGNAIRFILTGGEYHDIMQAEALIENFFPGYVIADKDYDSNKFVLL